MKSYFDHAIDALGFDSIKDIGQSVFHTDGKIIPITKLSSVLGTLSWVFEEYIGLTPIVYLAFVVLIVTEFFTGIKASLKEGHKIESRKFGRIIFKIGIYTVILGIINIFSKGISSPIIFGGELNIYDWFYYVIINMLILQLLLSVLENLDRLGYMESYLILRIIKKSLNKWIDLSTNPDKINKDK